MLIFTIIAIMCNNGSLVVVLLIGIIVLMFAILALYILAFVHDQFMYRLWL